jgi:hypothetical protein
MNPTAASSPLETAAPLLPFASTQTAPAPAHILAGRYLPWEFVMKWAGMYLVGFVVLIGGVLAALWKLGVLQRIGTTWTLIGVAILLGVGIMISVANSGNKENVEINRK